jgi:NAD(P)-dependent dehydrogenase (short-subunit alcohol dehydrogenase family)
MGGRPEPGGGRRAVRPLPAKPADNLEPEREGKPGMRLEGKVALIAGAGRNMSRGTAVLFAQEGARVVLAARRSELMEETAELVRGVGGEATCVQADLTQAEGARRAVGAAAGLGRLDVLVNNAGGFFTPDLRLAAIEDGFWDQAVGNLLRGMFLCCREAAAVMSAQGRGSIVNVGASFATRQQANPAYAAGKAGVVGLTQNLAKELHPRGVRVNCIAPGLVWRKFEGRRVGAPPAELDRYGSAEDVAFAALYLASDESAWVTGQTLVVDGGDEILTRSRPERERG